jgi:hypothetical protein
MTTTYNKSLIEDFSGNLQVNQLLREIKSNEGITPYCITVNNLNSDNVDIIFDSALSAGEQTTLNTIISNHVPNNSLIPFTETVTLNPNDIHVVEHFHDEDYSRKLTITNETTESADNSIFTFNDTYTGDYKIEGSGIAELSPTSFSLAGDAFQEGSSIAHEGTASASSSTQPASNANDNNSNTFWYNTTSEQAVGAWWKVDFGSTRGIYSAEVIWYSTTYYSTEISIEYSLNNVDWTLALNQTGITYTSTGNTTGYYKFPAFNTPIFARYVRFTCNASNNSTYFIMREVYLYEALGSGYSTIDHGIINNIKTERQIDTSGWSSLNSSTLVGTFPAGTTTRILISFNNQATWVYWNGSAWISSTLANISTTSMTQTTFNALSQANYASVNGLNSATESIDIALCISTTDDTKTPFINYVNFNYNSKVFRELLFDSSVRVRFTTKTKTEIKNISGSTKNLNIIIDTYN